MGASVRSVGILTTVLAVCGLVSPANAIDVDISGQNITIPSPTGFSEISNISPDMFSMFETLLPADSRLLGVFVSQEDVGRLLRGEQANLQQYMLVQSDKTLEGLSLTKSDFSQFRTAFRRQLETLLQDDRESIDAAVKKAGEAVSKTIGTQVSMQMDKMAFLGVDSETASSISASLLAKYVSSGEAGQVQGVMAGVMASVLVKGKVIRLHVYRPYEDDSDVARAREQAEGWLKGILAANEATWPAESGAIIPQGTTLTSTAKELLSGEWVEYRLESHPKAQGLDISLKYPKSWKPAEGLRPHIIQKFTGQPIGGTFASCVLLAIETQPAWARAFLEGELGGAALIESLKEMLPDNAVLTDGGQTRIDGEPCGWLKFFYEDERVGVRWRMYSLEYLLFHQGRTFVIQCHVGRSAGDEEILEDAFASYLPIFQMIGNSVVIHDKWSTDSGSPLNTIMQRNFGEYWLLSIVLSAILTWGIGLLPPTLIRFVVLRRSISKWAAIIIAGVFLFANIVIFTALGSQSKTHGALLLVAFASYAILRSGHKRHRTLQSSGASVSVEPHPDPTSTQMRGEAEAEAVAAGPTVITDYVQEELEKVVNQRQGPPTREIAGPPRPVLPEEPPPHVEPVIQESSSRAPNTEDSSGTVGDNHPRPVRANRAVMVTVAIVACAAEAFIYAIIGALLGWRHGGGAIPMMILFGVWVTTWRAITKHASSSRDASAADHFPRSRRLFDGELSKPDGKSDPPGGAEKEA